MQKKEHAKRFLIKVGTGLSFIPVEDVAAFFSRDGLTYLLTKSGKKHLIDNTLENLAAMTDMDSFFRINRSTIIHIQSVRKVSDYFNHRLKVDITVHSDIDTIVSREKAKAFKDWLGK